MPEWTQQQKCAIETRGEDLLVSAAAGSGKTAVLSARVGDFVEKGGRLDRLLIVTFTKLAAAEMRSRIAKELNDRAARHPDDAHLRRQALVLYKAKISTIDSFGIDLLRRNFQRAGVSPDFTVMDEGDVAVLKEQILQRQLEEFYQTFPEGFSDFLDLFGGETDDRAAEKALTGLCSHLENIPFPDRWLDLQRERLAGGGTVARTVCDMLLPLGEEYEEILTRVVEAEAFGGKGKDAVESDLAFFRRFNSLLRNGDWDGVCAHVRFYSSETVRRTGEPTWEKALFAEYHGKSNGGSYVKFLASEIFSMNEGSLAADLATLRPAMEFYYAWAGRFREALREEMHRRSAYSFAVISELALGLVVADYDHRTGAFRPSEAAEAERKLYDEVLIDEYQDVNDLQDLFFRSVTDGNCFAVGDVKQSIYGFRGSNPDNFLRKKETCRVITLNKNFRSRSGILDYVNFLFRGLFSKAVGGMEYGEDEALYPGRTPDGGEPTPEGYASLLPPAAEPFPAPAQKAPEPHAEVLLIPTAAPGRGDDEDEPDGAEGTAMLCAKLVRDALCGGATVYDKGMKATRPMRPSDIAVLLRVSSSFPVFERVFRQAGIPLLSSDGGTFLESPEVGGVLAFLQAVNDPWDDLALFVTLTGHVFSFSPEEVSYLKDPARKRPLWEGLLEAAREDAGWEAVRVRLEKFRILAENLPIPRLIWEIYASTDYLGLESATDPSARSNLMKFYSFACRYTRSDGLFGFLEYAERARASENAKESDSAPDGEFVRMMTIHKSKGLEFAWCIVPEMERRFRNDTDSVVFDTEYGAAARVRNGGGTASFSTLVRELIRMRRKRAERAELLRVLYVALTRARDRLTVLCRCAVKPEKLEAHAVHSSKGKVHLNALLSSSSFRKILLDRTVLHPYANAIHSALISPEQTPAEDLRVSFVRIPEEVEPLKNTEKGLFCGLSEAELKERFSFRYNGALSSVPAKVSVTEIAKSPADPDAALLLQSPPLRRPAFLDKESLSATEAGTAIHLFCQFADFDRPVEEELSRLVSAGHLTETAAAALDLSQLRAFLEGDLMKEIRAGVGYQREVRFVCRIPVSYYSGNPGEEGEMLMQGAIDLLCETEEGYLVVDFKSDRATEEELLSRYSRQLNLYATAVRRLYGKPVIGCKIWSFRLGKAIDVPEELM